MKQFKKIAVTGGLGFIGAHVIDNLLEKDYEITVFDRHYDEKKFTEYGWKNKVDFRMGDLKDRDGVFELIRHCDAVINLGGILGTQEMISNPLPAVEVNIIGAINVFDAIKQFKVRGFQVAVGNYYMNNPYSISKSTAERFALMYNTEHNTDIRILRMMNVYGERQLHTPIRKIFPNVVIPALLNKDITIYGSGEQVMDLVYVKNIAEIITRVTLYNDIPNDVMYEAGVGGRMTINKAVEMILEITNSKSKVHKIAMRPGETENSIVEISEQGWEDLNKYLNYTKEDLTPMKEAMIQSINWYRKHLDELCWDN